MNMKILVVGGGGREHALADALSRSSNVEIYSVMGKENPGIAALSADVYICKETEIDLVAEYAEAHGILYAVVGPEAPLEAGSLMLSLPGVSPVLAPGRKPHGWRPTRSSVGT